MGVPQGTGVVVDHAADAAALERWRSLRAARDLQFSPAAPWHPRPDPPWLNALGRWLEHLFAPVARALGGAWPWLEKGLLGLAVVGGLWLVWRLMAPWVARWRRPGLARHDAPVAQDVALPPDAEALAAAGDFAGAIHAVLRRCVAQVGAARPDLIHPASTAREIAALPALPKGARKALAAMTGRVEASRYALRAPGEADWQIARAAFADFTRVALL